MNSTSVIIIFCLLLLLAYMFDLTSKKTKIPSVILLLFLGFGIQKLVNYLAIPLPNFAPILEAIATIGLILIVLEGSLELELDESKLPMIKKSFLGALISMLALSFTMAFFFHKFGGFSYKLSLISAIPFGVISSAIAIPSVSGLATDKKEFVIYESSLSDIIGVIFFNFVALNEIINAKAFLSFGLEFFLIIAISLIASIFLSILLRRIEHHVKFIPITLIIILLYSVMKIYHLPALVFILIFGIFIGNFHLLYRFEWMNKFKTDNFQDEVKKFTNLTIEGAFLIRTVFFLLFGYLIKTEELLNPNTFYWALLVVFFIYFFRVIQLKISKIELSPLLFVSPRGLITILLFLSILPSQNIEIVNKSLVIQVVIMTALIMAFGMMFTSKGAEVEKKEETQSGETDATKEGIEKSVEEKIEVEDISEVF